MNKLLNDIVILAFIIILAVLGWYGGGYLYAIVEPPHHSPLDSGMPHGNIFGAINGLVIGAIYSDLFRNVSFKKCSWNFFWAYLGAGPFLLVPYYETPLQDFLERQYGEQAWINPVVLYLGIFVWSYIAASIWRNYFHEPKQESAEFTISGSPNSDKADGRGSSILDNRLIRWALYLVVIGVIYYVQFRM